MTLNSWLIQFIITVYSCMLTIYLIFRWIFNDKDKEEIEMAVVYATLIIKGKRVFHAIPTTIKRQVADVLIDMELEELIDEDEYKPTKVAE